MLKFLIQKKVILILLLFFLLAFSLQANWFKKPAFLEDFKKNLAQKINKISQVLAQEYPPYFFPHFPQRLVYLLSEIEKLSEELKNLNEELINEHLEKSDCQFALSECLPKITFGDPKCQPAKVRGFPYEDVHAIEDYKSKIADRIDNLSFLKEVLEEEMKGGLEKELTTLREEVAKELEGKLNDVLRNTDEIILAAKRNQVLYDEDYTGNCTAQCQPGSVCGIQGCLMVGSGPQKNISINSQIEVGLEDMDLGQVGLKFGLVLPDELQFPKLGDIIFTIPPQTLEVCFPFEPIRISFDPPIFPTLPVLKFTCPLPKLKLPPLPPIEFPEEEEIEISAPEIPEIKWCPEMPKMEIDLETIKQELLAEQEKELENFETKIDDAIKKINEQLKTATEEEKENLEKIKKELQEESKKVKGKIPEKIETPPVEFEAEQTSKEYHYQTSQSQVDIEDVSFSYQCGQTSSDKEVETGAGFNWYFETLSWLMEECATSLPTMRGSWGPKEKTADCYKPDKVIETIINECESLWQDYCQKPDKTPEPPQICKKIKYSCFQNSDIAAAIQCQKLFGQKIPPECDYTIATPVNGKSCPYKDYPVLKNGFCVSKKFNPIETLKNKCQELREKEIKTPPEPCKILSLFTGKIEVPDSQRYSASATTSCPAQKLLNLPLGFGGGIGFDCPGLSVDIPKIDLPKIVIPDIKLPEFKIPPFLEIELPSLIIEDLNLPDLELCDLNNCSEIFPSLYFEGPELDLPSLDLSVPLPQMSGLQLTGRLDLPSIRFSLPRIKLFNLLLPELELPKISLPSPKFGFKITGIDLSAIFDLIFTFILNALDVPDLPSPENCYVAKIELPSLKIKYPDYYFSFDKFPTIPEIDFCKDINEFCKEIKTSLGENGWLKKAKEIETAFSNTINQIQKKIDKVSEAVDMVQKAIEETFKKVYGEKIRTAIEEQLKKKGLSFKDYIDPKTEKIDLSKLPYPGVFPVKVADKECLPVSIPPAKFIIKIVDRENYPEPKGDYPGPKIVKIQPPASQSQYEIEYEIYVGVDIPEKITVSWPEELKKIKLIRPLSYQLPKIPLSELSYREDFSIKGPGFQPRTFSFKLEEVQGDCSPAAPIGGNPLPIDDIKSNLDEIKDKQSKIASATQEIIEILE